MKFVHRIPPDNVMLTYGFRRPSPSYEIPADDPMDDEHREDDSEARSVFVSQLAARLTARDLGYFFEDKLGEGSVMDSRIVTDRISRRSKGCVLFYYPPLQLCSRIVELAMWSSVQLNWLIKLSISAVPSSWDFRSTFNILKLKEIELMQETGECIYAVGLTRADSS